MTDNIPNPAGAWPTCSPRDGPEMQLAFADLESRTAAFEDRRAQLSPDIPETNFLDDRPPARSDQPPGHTDLWLCQPELCRRYPGPGSQPSWPRCSRRWRAWKTARCSSACGGKDLDDEPARRLMAGSGDYRYWLEEMRHFKPHTLSEPEEKMVNIKNTTGVSALNNLYDAITNRYVFQLTVDGEEKELTRGEMMVYVRDPDPELRKAAYQELYRVYGQDGPMLGRSTRPWCATGATSRSTCATSASPIAARNLVNDIPDEWSIRCWRCASAMHRSSSAISGLKARLLGMDACAATISTPRWPSRTSVTSSTKPHEMVLDSFQRFDPRLADAGATGL